jgi:hypothetical protein
MTTGTVEEQLPNRLMIEDQARLYRLELAKQQMLLIRYRELLEEHGIEPPDVSGKDLLAMWRECRKLIEAAGVFVAALGTSKEMLDGPWRQS